MFLLAFVSMGIFATASNGKVEKIKVPLKKELKKIKVPFVAYQVSFNCSPYVVTFCCFSTYAEALQFARDNRYLDCNRYIPN